MGEALALTWNDVFLEEGCIRIHKSAYYRNGKTHIGTVKTTQSNRRIYIHKAFVNEVRVWKSTKVNRLSKLTDTTDELQIFQFSGEPMTAPNVNNFRKSLKKRLPEHLKLLLDLSMKSTTHSVHPEFFHWLQQALSLRSMSIHPYLLQSQQI